MLCGFYTDSALVLGSASDEGADFMLDIDEKLYERFRAAEAEFDKLSLELRQFPKIRKR